MTKVNPDVHSIRWSVATGDVLRHLQSAMDKTTVATERTSCSVAKVVAHLTDEKGRAVGSEKMVEVDWEGKVPLRAGNQFGVGRVR